MRYLSNQQSVLPKSQQNRISEQWGVMATHQTGKSVKNHIAEQHDFFCSPISPNIRITQISIVPDLHPTALAMVISCVLKLQRTMPWHFYAETSRNQFLNRQ
jgi:hypothetical protein